MNNSPAKAISAALVVGAIGCFGVGVAADGLPPKAIAATIATTMLIEAKKRGDTDDQ